MALDNYANLKTTIANFLARDDLTSEIDDFIDLTEADFNRRLRIRAMETVDTSFTVDSETESLPTGFLQVRSFILTSPEPDSALVLMTPFHQTDIRGSYNLALAGVSYTLEISGEASKPKASLTKGETEFSAKLIYKDNWITLSFTDKQTNDVYRTTAIIEKNTMSISGKAVLPSGVETTFTPKIRLFWSSRNFPSSCRKNKI